MGAPGDRRPFRGRPAGRHTERVPDQGTRASSGPFRARDDGSDLFAGGRKPSLPRPPDISRRGRISAVPPRDGRRGHPPPPRLYPARPPPPPGTHGPPPSPLPISTPPPPPLC